MEKYVPPQRPEQTYSQGFWHAVIAAILYLLLSMILMVNMLGYFLGHYKQHFELSDEQRNLILQTMLFFFWLAGGAGVYTKVDGELQFVDALYFCDVTILTVGFGDFNPSNDASRGLIFPYSVGGIIILGLMISSIQKFAQEISHDNIVKTHAEKRRVKTIDRSVSNTVELRQKRIADHANGQNLLSVPSASRKEHSRFRSPHRRRRRNAGAASKLIQRVRSRGQKIILLQEEKDRFDAMRSIQESTSNFKKYSALTMSSLILHIVPSIFA
ncbi:MAG: hypothetical protein Q9174_007536 [Haloplaca sp. 1 TL-2023]